MDSDAKSVGLAGDGDEISAIYDVEKEFGIKFDYEDAPGRFTAGDVFESLRTKLAGSELPERQIWERFTTALSQETGVDPKSLSRESPLILEGHPWRKVHDFFGHMWFVLFAIVGLTIVIAIID